MCRKGTNIEHLEEMQDDLMRNIRYVISMCDGEIKMSRVCEEAVRMPARRFYISTLQAYKVICRMRKHGAEALEGMPGYRKEMFYEIWERTERNMVRFRYSSESLFTIVSHVVSEPAPRFYMSAKYARLLYFTIKKKNKCAAGT